MNKTGFTALVTSCLIVAVGISSINAQDAGRVRSGALKAAAADDTSAEDSTEMPFRKWTSRDGRYTIEARLISRSADHVVLERKDGERITVPIDRLTAIPGDDGKVSPSTLPKGNPGLAETPKQSAPTEKTAESPSDAEGTVEQPRKRRHGTRKRTPTVKLSEDSSIKFLDKGFIGNPEFQYTTGGSVDLGDIDGDGDLDVVTLSSRDGLRIYDNLGTRNVPQFKPGETIDAYKPYGASGGDVDLVDFDGDGDVDIFATLAQSVRFLENTSAGEHLTFENRGIIGNPIAENRAGVGVGVGDMDGDGDFDVVTVTVRSGIKYFENVSDGSLAFEDRGKIAKPPFVLYSGTLGLTLADLDDDGDLDVITAAPKRGVYWFPNQGKESLALRKPLLIDTTIDVYGLVSPDTLDIVSGDFDNDGDIDLLTSSGRPGVKYLENVGSAGSPKFVDNGVVADPKTYNSDVVAITAGDLDADGDLDFVTASAFRAKRFENPTIK